MLYVLFAYAALAFISLRWMKKLDRVSTFTLWSIGVLACLTIGLMIFSAIPKTHEYVLTALPDTLPVIVKY